MPQQFSQLYIGKKRACGRSGKMAVTKRVTFQLRNQLHEGCLQERKKPEKAKMKDVENDTQTICCIVKQLKHQKNIVDENSISDDTEKLAFNEKGKKKSWKQHYERVLNAEFSWIKEDLFIADPVLGPHLFKQTRQQNSLFVRRKMEKPLVPQAC